LPSLTPEEISVFIPADTIQIENPNYIWKIIFWFYSTMKSIFFGAEKLKLPPENTVYLATASTL